jgi:hypothetical protein
VGFSLIFFFFFFGIMFTYGCVPLDDPSSLRITEVRAATVPCIFSMLELAVARDVKLRNGAPIPHSGAGALRLFSIATNFVAEKKVALFSVIGSLAATQRFEGIASQHLSRLVITLPALNLVSAEIMAQEAATPAKAPLRRSQRGKDKAGAAPDAMEEDMDTDDEMYLAIWITRVATLIFDTFVEALMSFWCKPATCKEATDLSKTNAQAALRRDMTEDDLLTCASAVVFRRLQDLQLTLPNLPAEAIAAVFAADFVARLPASIKSKVTAFDEAAKISVPEGLSFETRFASPDGQAICTAQLSAWAMAIKADKASFAKAVNKHVAALMPHPPVAGVPPPGRAPASGARRGGAMSCLCCEKADRPAAGHTRETCEHYKCNGCGRFAPGHIWRTCPNPSVGGPCPPHVPG